MSFPKSILNKDIRKLFKTLGAGNLRFVGGVVRNAILELPIGDIDFATTLTPDKVIQKLDQAGIKYVPTGIDHGTVMAVINGTGYEITTLRRDVETDGRHAVVSYTTDWAEDAARRDFTMNALYADMDGNIYDPLGHGLADLENRKVKFVGDAATRIQEDYLRILRFFRFHAIYGKGAPDKKALAACAQFSPHIKTLSRERITQEFTKILMAPAPQKILTLMAAHKILPDVIGKDFDPDAMTSLLKLAKITNTLDPDILFCARLYAVDGFHFKDNAKYMQSLILNKKQLSLLNDLAAIQIKNGQEGEFKNLLYAHPWPSVAAAFLVSAVQKSMPVADFKKQWTLFMTVKRPTFPVSGKDLLALGFVEGKDMGDTLKTIEQQWIASGFTRGKAELLAPFSFRRHRH